MSKWTQPQEVTDLQVAFPSDVTGTLLPPVEEIPKEFFGTNKWTQFVNRMFALGWDGTNPSLVMNPDVDASKAFKHYQAVLGSWEPKHENKIAGAAYLLSLWFKDVVTADQIQTEETQ